MPQEWLYYASVKTRAGLDCAVDTSKPVASMLIHLGSKMARFLYQGRCPHNFLGTQLFCDKMRLLSKRSGRGDSS